MHGKNRLVFTILFERLLSHIVKRLKSMAYVTKKTMGLPQF
jgi:hypothetical protein